MRRTSQKEWKRLRDRLVKHSKSKTRPGELSVVIVAPEDIVTYLGRIWTCPYTNERIEVAWTKSRKNLRVKVGEDRMFVPNEEQNFYAFQAEFDRFLKGRLGW